MGRGLGEGVLSLGHPPPTPRGSNQPRRGHCRDGNQNMDPRLPHHDDAFAVKCLGHVPSQWNWLLLGTETACVFPGARAAPKAAVPKALSPAAFCVSQRGGHSFTPCVFYFCFFVFFPLPSRFVQSPGRQDVQGEE